MTTRFSRNDMLLCCYVLVFLCQGNSVSTCYGKNPLLWWQKKSMLPPERVVTGYWWNRSMTGHSVDRFRCCRPLVGTSDCFRSTRQPAVAVTARRDIPVRVCHWKERAVGWRPPARVFLPSPMKKGDIRSCLRIPPGTSVFLPVLSENRVGKQYFVIDHPADFHRCLRHHELYAPPFHPGLLHQPVYDEPRREPGAPFVFPYDEAFIAVGPADVPVAGLLIVGEVHPSSAENPQLDGHRLRQIDGSPAVQVDGTLSLVCHFQGTWVLPVIYYQCHDCCSFTG